MCITKRETLVALSLATWLAQEILARLFDSVSCFTTLTRGLKVVIWEYSQAIRATVLMEELDYMNCSLTPLDYVAKFYQAHKNTSF